MQSEDWHFTKQISRSQNLSLQTEGKILFLDWDITHIYMIADPQRIQKICKFPFPDSKKSVRAFLSLVNSLRTVIHIEVIEQVAILTPLTSAKTLFHVTENHKHAFEQIKFLLTRESLFSSLFDEKAETFLYVDAVTSSGVIGAVQAQQIKGQSYEKMIPGVLDLEDKVHRLIYDKELPYEPCRLYTKLLIVITKPALLKTFPL
jgi:hypothetical protein